MVLSLSGVVVELKEFITFKTLTSKGSLSTVATGATAPSVKAAM